ncbi:MAG: ligase-associated DNA damage response endonuclease PdeM [Planctomycetota bacterium]
MIEGSIGFAWHGVPLVLLPGRSVWMPDERALLVTDVHLGKPASFRSSGIPVPEQVTAGDLNRLSALIDAVGAERLVVLGDLIHDSAALLDRTRDAVLDWRASIGEVAVELIPGNHDRKAASCESLGVSVLEEAVVLGGLTLTHEPPESAAGPVLCGHVHPAVSVGDPRSPARVRSACFWFEGMVGVLPAFGRFTGGQAVRAIREAGLFAAGDRAVVPINQTARGWACSGRCGQSRSAYDRG